MTTITITLKDDNDSIHAQKCVEFNWRSDLQDVIRLYEKLETKVVEESNKLNSTIEPNEQVSKGKTLYCIKYRFMTESEYSLFSSFVDSKASDEEVLSHCLYELGKLEKENCRLVYDLGSLTILE